MTRGDISVHPRTIACAHCEAKFAMILCSAFTLLKLRAWYWFGRVLMATEIPLDAVSVAAIIRTETTVNPVRGDRASHLVVSGLHRVTRTPMYLGWIALLADWALLLGSLAPWLLAIGFERLKGILQIRPEEMALATRFGNEHAQYIRRVNRSLGRVSR